MNTLRDSRGGRVHKLQSFVASLALAAAISGLETPARAGSFLLLVNATNPITSITRADLKKAFTGGKKQWENGAVIQVGLIPSDAPETQYLAALFDTSIRDLIGRIQEQVFKGEMRRPTVLKSSQDCLALARSHAGAVCVAAAGLPIPSEARVVTVGE
ncbi:MAG TPA: hypothetical protein VGI10_22875 [Polyangiaceae bacterium]|jgi:hypothetical protein